MKARNPLLPVLTALTLAFAGTALAQGAPADQTASTTFQTAQGQVTINSTSAAAPQIAAAPAFKQIAGNDKWITQEQAAAYPPLANDFLNASRGAERINKTQYENWVKQLR